MRILGIVASAFSGLVQKIYSWNNTYKLGSFGTLFVYSAYNAASSTSKILMFTDTGGSTQMQTRNTISSYVGPSSITTITNSLLKSVASNSEVVALAYGTSLNPSTTIQYISGNNAITSLSSSTNTTKGIGGLWDSVEERFIFPATTGSSGIVHILSKSGSVYNLFQSTIAVNGELTDPQDIGFNQSSSNPLYIAVTNSNTTNIYSRTSTSFSTSGWTTITLPASSTWRSVAYGNGIWVVIGGGTTYCTSTDGVNWTLRNWNQGSDRPSRAAQVRFINNLFVTTLRSSINGIRVATSPDGINWTITGYLSSTDASYAAVSWDYASHEDIFFSATSSLTDGVDAIGNIVRGV